MESDVEVHVEVVTHTLEYVVWRLLKLHNDISLKHVRNLLTLSLVHYLFIICHASFNFKCQGLCLHSDFSSPAFIAVFFVTASLSSTRGAVLLHLHFHEAHVLNHSHDSLPIALGARFRFASFSTTSLALRAVYITIDIKFFLYSIVELFKRHRKVKLVFWALSAIVTASEEIILLKSSILLQTLTSQICQLHPHPANRKFVF